MFDWVTIVKCRVSKTDRWKWDGSWDEAAGLCFSKDPILVQEAHRNPANSHNVEHEKDEIATHADDSRENKTDPTGSDSKNSCVAQHSLENSQNVLACDMTPLTD